MTRLRILFADDHIPDDNIPDADIAKTLKKQHPRLRPDQIDESVAVRKAVTILRDANYDVTVSGTFKDTLELISRSHFDIAVVDLGWVDDDTLKGEKLNAGWKICAALDEADKKSQSKPTFQII